MDNIVRQVAALITDDFDEYEGLDDEDTFDPEASDDSWSGGDRSGLWAFDGFEYTVDGHVLLADAKIAYSVDFFKGSRGSYYDPPEDASIEVSNPEVVWFQLHDFQGGNQIIVSWRVRPTLADPAGIHPRSFGLRLSDEQIKEIIEYFTTKWYEDEASVIEFEGEVAAEPDGPDREDDDIEWG